jgi:DNA-binding winged helix-turn-helix (wHTH) protein
MKLLHIIEGGSGAPMTPQTTEALRYLLDHPGALCSSDNIAEACGFSVASIRTVMSNLRRALGDHSAKLLSSPKNGYAWIGDPVKIFASIVQPTNVVESPLLANYAVVPADVVAKRLGITQAEVLEIEKSALAKLAMVPELKTAWRDLLQSRGRLHYDPLYEIWLFSVVDKIAYQPVEETDTDPVEETADEI